MIDLSSFFVYIGLNSQKKSEKGTILAAVLWIHLILMLIWILDLLKKRIDQDPDPGHKHIFKIY